MFLTTFRKLRCFGHLLLILKTHKEWPDSISSKSCCPQKYRNGFSTKTPQESLREEITPFEFLCFILTQNESISLDEIKQIMGTLDILWKMPVTRRIMKNPYQLSFVTLTFVQQKFQSTAISTAQLRQFQRVGCDQDWQTGSENGR